MCWCPLAASSWLILVLLKSATAKACTTQLSSFHVPWPVLLYTVGDAVRRLLQSPLMYMNLGSRGAVQQKTPSESLSIKFGINLTFTVDYHCH